MNNAKIIIVSNRTSIPHLKEKLEARIKEVGGAKRMEHLLIRQQIIATRIYHERYTKSYTMDAAEKLAYLRHRLRETREY